MYFQQFIYMYNILGGHLNVLPLHKILVPDQHTVITKYLICPRRPNRSVWWLIYERPVWTFQLHEFLISSSWIHDFNIQNSRFQLHEFTISTSRIRDFNIQNSRIHYFNFTNSLFQLHEFTIWTSLFQLREFTFSTSRIHGFNFMNSRFQLQEFTCWTSRFKLQRICHVVFTSFVAIFARKCWLAQQIRKISITSYIVIYMNF